MLQNQSYIRVRSLLVTSFDPDSHLQAIKEVKVILKFDTVNQSKYYGLVASLNLISQSSIKFIHTIMFITEDIDKTI